MKKGDRRTLMSIFNTKNSGILNNFLFKREAVLNNVMLKAINICNEWTHEILKDFFREETIYC